jgi:uncharacterized coiled-coil protein SlyX
MADRETAAIEGSKRRSWRIRLVIGIVVVALLAISLFLVLTTAWQAFSSIHESSLRTSLIEILVAMGAGIAASAIASLSESSIRRGARGETTEQRIGRLGKSLSESVRLIDEIKNEIESRQALLSRLRDDVKTYERLKAVKQTEVDAVIQSLRGEIRKEGRRSFWRDFAVKLLFFVMGVVVTLILRGV